MIDVPDVIPVLTMSPAPLKTPPSLPMTSPAPFLTMKRRLKMIASVVGAKSLVVWIACRYARAKAQDTLTRAVARVMVKAVARTLKVMVRGLVRGILKR